MSSRRPSLLYARRPDLENLSNAMIMVREQTEAVVDLLEGMDRGVSLSLLPAVRRVVSDAQAAIDLMERKRLQESAEPGLRQGTLFTPRGAPRTFPRRRY